MKRLSRGGDAWPPCSLVWSLWPPGGAPALPVQQRNQVPACLIDLLGSRCASACLPAGCAGTPVPQGTPEVQARFCPGMSKAPQGQACSSHPRMRAQAQGPYGGWWAKPGDSCMVPAWMHRLLHCRGTLGDVERSGGCRRDTDLSSDCWGTGQWGRGQSPDIIVGSSQSAGKRGRCGVHSKCPLSSAPAVYLMGFLQPLPLRDGMGRQEEQPHH